MNCYYSNLIEGHYTSPRDIDRALTQDYSQVPEKRNLQLEARAHIEVQQKIDLGECPKDPVSSEFICWVHREFCRRLPEALLVVKAEDSGRIVQIKPGTFRTSGVVVGNHAPPEAQFLADFMTRLGEAYSSDTLSTLRRLSAAGAAHHRLLWIHPFYDGNGRVAWLHSHAYLKEIGVGSTLWSVSRGLARNVETYRRLLAAADMGRENDFDGRTSRPAKSLLEFCRFSLRICVDQVDFMSSVVEPSELLRRIEIFTTEEISAKRLLPGSFSLLREAIYAGEFERGRAAEITGYGTAQARKVLSRLIERSMLVSSTPKGPVRIAFPIDVVERYFPRLYPSID